MRVLVTGGTGYLGRALLARLPAPVWATFHTGAPAGAAEWHPLDLREPGAAAALIHEVRPHAVIHTAYAARGEHLDRVTCLAAEEIAAACAQSGARLIHLSTDLVFGGRPGGGYREEDAPRPLSDYGHAKAEAEVRVRQRHPEALVVRTSLLYGGAVPGPQERAAAAAEWTFFTDEFRSPIAVGDLADALLELLPRGSTASCTWPARSGSRGPSSRACWRPTRAAFAAGHRARPARRARATAPSTRAGPANGSGRACAGSGRSCRRGRRPGVARGPTTRRRWPDGPVRRRPRPRRDPGPPRAVVAVRAPRITREAPRAPHGRTCPRISHHSSG